VKNPLRFILLLAIVLLGIAPPTWAQTTQPLSLPNASKVIRLTLYPMATSRPALKYSLLPALDQQSRGNAATLYMMLPLRSETDERQKLMAEVYGYVDLPLDQMPRDQARRSLEGFADSIKLLELAARRMECHWDNSIPEQGIDAQLLSCQRVPVVQRHAEREGRGHAHQPSRGNVLGGGNSQRTG
jgi:hypothetical protein